MRGREREGVCGIKRERERERGGVWKIEGRERGGCVEEREGGRVCGRDRGGRERERDMPYKSW